MKAISPARLHVFSCCVLFRISTDCDSRVLTQFLFLSPIHSLVCFFNVPRGMHNTYKGSLFHAPYATLFYIWVRINLMTTIVATDLLIWSIIKALSNQLETRSAFGSCATCNGEGLILFFHLLLCFIYFMQ